jgi:hypothetical protein
VTVVTGGSGQVPGSASLSPGPWRDGWPFAPGARDGREVQHLVRAEPSTGHAERLILAHPPEEDFLRLAEDWAGCLCSRAPDRAEQCSRRTAVSAIIPTQR